MSSLLTLRLDSESQANFENLRQLHFPPERNLVPAHLTLFHQIPETEEIEAILRDAAATQSHFAVAVTGLRSLGKGVAYTLCSPILLELHQRLAGIFHDHLTAQDKQEFHPHIVIQNKATPEAAKALLSSLQSVFIGFEVRAIGLDHWRYLGGPWQHLQTFSF